MRIESKEAEQRAILRVVDLMAAAARTAPKGRGIDNLEVVILTDEDKDRLSAEMKRFGEEKEGAAFFVRDAGNVDDSEAVFLLGARYSPILLPNCGFCGFKDCGANKKADGMCAFNVTDLGIAIGSAVSVAADNRIDGRVMFSAGKAAIGLGIFSDTVKTAYGIPLSVSAKSPYFDRIPVPMKTIEDK